MNLMIPVYVSVTITQRTVADTLILCMYVTLELFIKCSYELGN